MRNAVYLAALVSFSSLTACTGGGSDDAANGGEARAVTQTRMDDIDKIEGTISDEMIDTSSSTDDAPLAGVGATSAAPATDVKKDEVVKSPPLIKKSDANDAVE